jgi:hypothetical protein
MQSAWLLVVVVVVVEIVLRKGLATLPLFPL